MALSFITRRASSPVLPLAIRAVGSPRTFHKAIANILNSPEELNKDSKDNVLLVKKLVDDDLLRVIDTVIKSKEHVQYKIPKKFPFDVKDNYFENRTIELKREYFNELIKVKADLTAESDKDASDRDSDDDKEDNKGSDSEGNSSSDSDRESNTGSDDTDAKSDESSNDHSDDRVHIPLTVNVSKGGSNLYLKLSVNAFPDEISIEHLEVGKEGIMYIPPEFWFLDDTMKDVLHRYLEVRGIDVSMAKVLYKYLEHIEKQEYHSMRLMELKKFIKK